MRETSHIKETLTGLGLDIEGAVISAHNLENTYFVFVRTVKNSENHQRPSNFKLKQIADELESELGILKFLIIDSGGNSITATLKAAFTRTFPDRISNVFTTDHPTKPKIWIEPKGSIDAEFEEKIEKVSSELLRVINVENYEIIFTNSADLPTPTACLIRIRKFSPITAERLQASFEESGIHIPNEDWLDRMLDRLRKSGRLLRLKESKAYVLTLKGLLLLGSSKSRRSPDIIRALDLAKRGE